MNAPRKPGPVATFVAHFAVPLCTTFYAYTADPQYQEIQAADERVLAAGVTGITVYVVTKAVSYVVGRVFVKPMMQKSFDYYKALKERYPHRTADQLARMTAQDPNSDVKYAGCALAVLALTSGIAGTLMGYNVAQNAVTPLGVHYQTVRDTLGLGE